MGVPRAKADGAHVTVIEVSEGEHKVMRAMVANAPNNTTTTTATTTAPAEARLHTDGIASIMAQQNANWKQLNVASE